MPRCSSSPGVNKLQARRRRRADLCIEHRHTQRGIYLKTTTLLRLQRVVRPVPGQQIDELAALLRADLVGDSIRDLDLAQVVAELRERKVRQARELRQLDALFARRAVEVERRVRVLLPAWNIDR